MSSHCYRGDKELFCDAYADGTPAYTNDKNVVRAHNCVHRHMYAGTRLS